MINWDIKAENLLIGFKGELKIAYFGSSTHTLSRSCNMCGTLDYFPPKMVEIKEQDTAIDIWSLGIFFGSNGNNTQLIINEEGRSSSE